MSLSTPNLTTASASDLPNALVELRSRLRSESEKKQLQLISELADLRDAGFEVLMDFLLECRSQPASLVDGKAYQTLFLAETAKTTAFLAAHFPQGVVPLASERNIDYSQLQVLLAQQNFQAADRITLEKLCELAGAARKWLYFTEVRGFPVADLQTINCLWLVHSEGKFGFSVQRDLWLTVGRDWDKLWSQIGWKAGNSWTRYPQEFTWDLSAPRGHLPLSNQLRGVRVISSLLSHPAWTQEAIAPSGL